MILRKPAKPDKLTNSNGVYRYSRVPIPPVAKPRNYQRRIGGPSLLFGTDIKMTILVTLALGGAMRPVTIWKTMGKRSPIVLEGLIESGLVVRWNRSRNFAYVALDPGHPTYEPMRMLLLAVAERYDYVKPVLEAADLRAVGPPVEPRRRDLEATFGDRRHTIALLLAYMLGTVRARDIAWLEKENKDIGARARLFMLASQGVFTVSRVRDPRTKRSWLFAFGFNDDEPLVPYVKAVLAVLDRYLPMLRSMAEVQVNQPAQKDPLKRRPRRASNLRW